MARAFVGVLVEECMGGRKPMTADEVAELRAEVERLTEGSAWKHRIMMFLMTAEADGKMEELVDHQVRMRMEELCRTEDRYYEVSEALNKAGLKVAGGEVALVNDERPLSEVLGSVAGQSGLT